MGMTPPPKPPEALPAEIVVSVVDPDDPSKARTVTAKKIESYQYLIEGESDIESGIEEDDDWCEVAVYEDADIRFGPRGNEKTFRVGVGTNSLNTGAVAGATAMVESAARTVLHLEPPTWTNVAVFAPLTFEALTSQTGFEVVLRDRASGMGAFNPYLVPVAGDIRQWWPRQYVEAGKYTPPVSHRNPRPIPPS